MIELIEDWHRKACPQPDARALSVQMGCHLEEIAEMMRTLTFISGDRRIEGAGTPLEAMLTEAADALKSGAIEVVIEDRIAFADSIADQIVTATGTGYRAKVNVEEAVRIVNRSNWSKFDDNGDPIFNAQGKVIKGPRYTEPDLAGCV